MRTDEIRTDQVGSQQRPRELLAARAAHQARTISDAELAQVEDAAIVDSLRRQVTAGLDVLSDGEFRREAWMTGITDALDGFANEGPLREVVMPDGSTELVRFHNKALAGRITQRRRLVAHEASFLLAHAPGRFKVTLPSPNMIGLTLAADLAESPYADRAELLADLLPIYQTELAALADEGVPYIQLDQTIVRFADDEARAQLVADGMDPETELALETEADNACLAVLRDSGVVTAKHLCRGSRTTVRGGGDYEWVGERVFSTLDVDRFLLEYDSDAVGGFEPLRFIPKGKVAVLGLVTSKYPTLESQDELLRKIDQAAKYLPVEQLAISPQCGFGGSADNNFMSVDEQFAKLENMVAVAARVWG